MMLLEAYINEFIAIVDHLLKNKDSIFQRDIMLIDKIKLDRLLDKNKYKPSNEKLKVWKSLHWISTEKNRITKVIYNKESGKAERKTAIRLDVFYKTKELKQRNIDERGDNSTLHFCLNEYIGIVNNLYKNETSINHNEEILYIDRIVLDKKINKYDYNTDIEKLKNWRALKWILTEENRMTKAFYNNKSCKLERKIAIDLNVFSMLEALSREEIIEI